MRNWTRVLLIGLCLAVPVVLLNCGILDSDDGPTDVGGGTGNNPPPGGGAQGEYDVVVYSDPPTLEATGVDIAKITASIHRFDNGARIPNGANVTFRTNLGSLNTDGTSSGEGLIVVTAFGGRAECYLVSGLVEGTARVTAEVWRSYGYVDVPFTEPDID